MEDFLRVSFHARVGVRVLVLVDVVCVMLVVLIAHVVFHAVSTVFVASFL